MFEVTRRCNFQCEHCMRGDAQNVDLSETAIDNLLDQTLAMGDILFTGGEPLLALDKIEYIIDGMINRKIPFQSIQIITNGTQFSEEFYRVMRKAYAYMLSVHEKVFGTEIKMPKRSLDIFISYDEFHKKFTDDMEKNLSILKENLGDIAYIKYHTAGVLPSLMGRGKQLKCGTYVVDNKPSRIEVYGKDRKCLCPALTYGASSQDYITVMCDMYLTAKGILIKGLGDNGEFEQVDKGRFYVADMNINEGVLSGIDAFNEKYPTLCYFISKEIEKEQEKINNSNVDAIYKKIQSFWNGYQMKEENNLFGDDEETEEEEENRKAYLYKALTENGKTQEEKDFLYNIAHIPVNENYIVQQALGEEDSYRIYPYLTKEQRKIIEDNGKNASKLISLNAKLECKSNMESVYCKNTTLEMLEAIDRFIHTDLKNVEWDKKLFYSLIILRILTPLDLPKETKVKKLEDFNLYDTSENPVYDMDEFYNLLDKFHNGEIEAVKLELEKERYERFLTELSNFGVETDLRFMQGKLNDENCHRFALEFFGYYDYYMEQIAYFKKIRTVTDKYSETLNQTIEGLNKCKQTYDFIMEHPFMTSFVFALRDLGVGKR